MLFLGYESAAQYWRAVRAGIVSYPEYSRNTTVVDEDHLLKDVKESKPDLSIQDQVKPHVLVSQMKFIHKSDDIAYHLCPMTLPKGSFYRHSFGVVVSSPELTLLQAAQALGNEGFISLLELCCEFMGCYSLNDGLQRGFLTCPQLVSKQRVGEYLKDVPKGFRGKTLLKRALKYVGENSRSPRETECFLAMTLPMDLGGYDLPHPILNLPSQLDEDDKSLTDDKDYLVDLAWKDGSVIFEYDGLIDHSESDKVLADKERRSILASKGKAVIVATKESVNDDGSFTKKVAQVFRALNLHFPQFTDDEIKAQSKLRSTLFDPTHHYKSQYITPITPAPQN